MAKMAIPVTLEQLPKVMQYQLHQMVGKRYEDNPQESHTWTEWITEFYQWSTKDHVDGPTLEQRVANAIELSNAVGNTRSVKEAMDKFTKEELISMLVMVRSVLEGTAIYIAKDNSFRNFT